MSSVRGHLRPVSNEWCSLRQIALPEDLETCQCRDHTLGLEQSFGSRVRQLRDSILVVSPVPLSPQTVQVYANLFPGQVGAVLELLEHIAVDVSLDEYDA